MAVNGGVGLGVRDGVAVGIGDGVAVGAGVGVTAVMVMSPLVWLGIIEVKSESISSKSFGLARQVNGVVSPAELLTRSIRRLNSVPEPLRAVMPSVAKAEIRSVLIDPGPILRTLAEMVQVDAVSPAASTKGGEKLTTDESNMKSPWKPTQFRLGSMKVAATGSMIAVLGGTEVSKLSFGRRTVTGVAGGVGVGD